ncbi:MAG TPA: type II toxin-antitoxin system VapC family toxin [Candidatus Eremiobacteraceae bacterium]|nr:type II toxin-antitoxin system VapC family toxin [Candidatus Eremiobacteraceae bacterium]
MSFVLDASITLAWIYANETTDPVLRVFDLLKVEGAWVPALWRWEVANALQMNVRRGRHGEHFRDNALAALTLFSIRTDVVSEQQAWGKPVVLAERHKLTVYDAAYLELALRRRLPFATLDKDLRSAASTEKVELLGA